MLSTYPLTKEVPLGEPPWSDHPDVCCRLKILWQAQPLFCGNGRLFWLFDWLWTAWLYLTARDDVQCKCRRTHLSHIQDYTCLTVNMFWQQIWHLYDELHFKQLNVLWNIVAEFGCRVGNCRFLYNARYLRVTLPRLQRFEMWVFQRPPHVSGFGFSNVNQTCEMGFTCASLGQI